MLCNSGTIHIWARILHVFVFVQTRHECICLHNSRTDSFVQVRSKFRPVYWSIKYSYLCLLPLYATLAHVHIFDTPAHKDILCNPATYVYTVQLWHIFILCAPPAHIHIFVHSNAYSYSVQLWHVLICCATPAHMHIICNSPAYSYFVRSGTCSYSVHRHILACCRAAPAQIHVMCNFGTCLNFGALRRIFIFCATVAHIQNSCDSGTYSYYGPLFHILYFMHSGT